jgi:hypothetical protein
MPDPTPTARRATDEEVERLREYAGKIEWSGLHYPVACVGALLARLDAAEAERDAALAREARLAEALRGLQDRDGECPECHAQWHPEGGFDPHRNDCWVGAILAEHDARRAKEGA